MIANANGKCQYLNRAFLVMGFGCDEKMVIINLSFLF